MSSTFNVLTYNIYVGHPFYFLEGKHSLIQSFRLESQIEHIKNLQPDIFCLQEVYSSQLLDVYKKKFPQYACFYQTELYIISSATSLPNYRHYHFLYSKTTTIKRIYITFFCFFLLLLLLFFILYNSRYVFKRKYQNSKCNIL